MKKSLPLIATVLVVGCNSYNDKMNDLLAQKKVAEDSLTATHERFLKSIPPVNIDFNNNTPSDTTGVFAREVAAKSNAFMQALKEDSIKSEIKKIDYSIDSLGKLK